jgi:hypothetical protein
MTSVETTTTTLASHLSISKRTTVTPKSFSATPPSMSWGLPAHRFIESIGIVQAAHDIACIPAPQGEYQRHH